MFILHEDGAAVDINDTNGIAAARGNQAGGFRWVRRIRFENNLKQKEIKCETISMQVSSTPPKSEFEYLRDHCSWSEI